MVNVRNSKLVVGKSIGSSDKDRQIDRYLSSMDPNNSMTPQQLAASLLKTVKKSVSTAVQFDEVPQELCWGEEINLDLWSMVLNDSNLVEMSKMPKEAFLPDASKKKVPMMFDRFFLEEPSFMPHGLVSLSMKDAKGITDYGLSMLLRRSPKLRHLDLTGCVAIGDVCMRELGTMLYSRSI